MAVLSEIEQVLDYRALGAAYREAGDQGTRNPLYNYYVASGARDAANEAIAAIGSATDPESVTEATRSLPLASQAGNGSVERYPTDTVEYVVMSRQKDPLPFNRKGSPARMIAPTGLDTRRMTMSYMFNAISLSARALQALRYPDNWLLQQVGREEVRRQATDFAIKHAVAKQVYLSKILSDGVVYLDENGEILESSSGSATTIDAGVPSGHKSQLNFDGGGNLITAAWDVAGTDIMKQLDNLRYAADVENVEMPKHVWLHGNSKFWIRANTEIKSYFSGIERLDQALMGDTFELNDYVFHFYSGTYVAPDGRTKPYIPITKAIITPELGSWFLNAVGMEIVPASVGTYGSVEEALAQLVEVYGQFAYGKLIDNPAALQIFLGDTFQYLFRNPKSVWIATVDF